LLIALEVKVVPRIEDQVIRDILELIAQETDGGKSFMLEELPGRSRAEVRRHLLVIRDEGLIHSIDAGTLDDANAMFITGLTPEGWRRLEELRH
jgi:hypothetical protein